MTVAELRLTLKGTVYEHFEDEVLFMQMRYETLTSFFQIDQRYKGDLMQ